MGTYVIKMPDIGEGIAEVELVDWHVKPGDMVAEEQVLADVMTDKASVEIPSHVAGKVVALTGKPGDVIAVGSEIIRLEVEGKGNADDAGLPTPAKPAVVKVEAAPAPASPKPAPAPAPALKLAASRPEPRPENEKPLAAPAVRRRAREMGVDLAGVAGSGPDGRITQEDLDGLGSRGNALRFAVPGGGKIGVQRHGEESVQVIGLRRKIAEKMQESKRRIPHYAYIDEVDMTELEELRAHLNKTKRADQPKLNVLPFLIRALTRILPDYPQINARFDDEAGIVHRHAAVHVGIATQTANGLIVPVVRNAEARDVWNLATEIARIAQLTRDGKASRDDLSGSTITITSLGALGGLATTPVINQPEVAIIGPNAIIERPVVKNGQIVVRKMMNLSSSFDHRVVDGFDAAEFIQRVKAMLEHPATLFMD